ncbi:MAG: DUF4253 domain-containing protein [Oscillospiraceae bacterium]
MGLFSKKPSENAQKIIDFLGCPCEYYPAGKSAEYIRSAYEDAFAKREMNGYTPVIVMADDVLSEWIDILRGDMPAGETPEQFRKRLISESAPNAVAWFTERLTEMKEEYGDYWEQITAENGENGSAAFKLSGFEDITTKKSAEVIIAKIPTEKPWEVFAWLPFGGWNECPEPAVMLSVGEYWYNRYHAIPAVITHDTLEFTAYPVKDRSAAVGLALEQYAFCSDIVDQGVQTIEVLADILTKSSVWSFWWD